MEWLVVMKAADWESGRQFVFFSVAGSDCLPRPPWRWSNGFTMQAEWFKQFKYIRGGDAIPCQAYASISCLVPPCNLNSTDASKWSAHKKRGIRPQVESFESEFKDRTISSRQILNFLGVTPGHQPPNSGALSTRALKPEQVQFVHTCQR